MPNTDARTDVEVEDFDINNGIISAFRFANKCYSYFYHIVYLECCKHVNVMPSGIQIKNSSFVEFVAPDLIASWKDTISSAEQQLLDTLLIGIADKMLDIEHQFWNMLTDLEKDVEDIDDVIDWWVKMRCHLEKEESRTISRKKKKLRKLLKDEEDKKEMAIKRFDEHLKHFHFKKALHEHGLALSPDMDNLINLILIGEPSQPEVEEEVEVEREQNQEGVAEEQDGRLRGVYVSDNILNLSKRKLNKGEISLLSKGLKFVPTPRFVDQAALKNDLEAFGRKLRLAWHFRNEESNFEANPFRKRSNFDPKGKDVAIEMYLSKLEDEILNINAKIRHHNVTREERNAIELKRLTKDRV